MKRRGVTENVSEKRYIGRTIEALGRVVSQSDAAVFAGCHLASVFASTKVIMC